MITTNPITIDGKQYDRYSLNLAITGKYNADGNTDANIACRLIPTRIENGEVITAESEAKAIVFGSLAGADAATLQAVGAIQTALQTYLQAKGL